MRGRRVRRVRGGGRGEGKEGERARGWREGWRRVREEERRGRGGDGKKGERG